MTFIFILAMAISALAGYSGRPWWIGSLAVALGLVFANFLLRTLPAHYRSQEVGSLQELAFSTVVYVTCSSLAFWLGQGLQRLF